MYTTDNEKHLRHSGDDDVSFPGSIILRPSKNTDIIKKAIKDSIMDTSKGVITFGRKELWRRRERKVERILKTLDNPNKYLSINKQIQLISSCYSAIDGMMPKYLYKYRDSNNENHIQNLANDTLYLSKPDDFNDPKECMSYVNPKKIVKRVLFNDENTVRAYQNVLEGADLDDEQLEELEKIARVSEYGLSQINKTKEIVNIACLSEVVDSTLMWAHYSNNHKGFAIRYKMDEQKWPQCISCNERDGVLCRRPEKPIYPVIYREKRYDVTDYSLIRASILEENNGVDRDDYPVPLLPILQKDRCWQYEREWRIVCYNTEAKYMSIKADAVFLGAQVENTLAKRLWNIAKEKGIKIYKMYVDSFSNSFDLQYADITDYSDANFNELIKMNNKNE